MAGSLARVHPGYEKQLLAETIREWGEGYIQFAELRKRAEEHASAGDGMRFKLYYLAMHAYVYYGAPDLAIGFASQED